MDYFIFSDYVYSLETVHNKHPGGSYIISNIKGREIDRFLFGMEPLEKIYQNMKPVSHSKWAMNIAGAPIAKMKRHNPYIGM